MKLQIAVRKLQPGCCQRSETRFYTPLHHVDDASEARVTQRHDVAERGGRTRGRDLDGPEETIAGRSHFDQGLEGLALLACTRRLKIPFERDWFAVLYGTIHFSLTAAAEEFFDGADGPR